MAKFRLFTKSLPDDILDSLTQIFLELIDRNYIKANEHFLEMAIGNAPWPIGATMVGIHARPGRERISSKRVARKYKFQPFMHHFYLII